MAILELVFWLLFAVVLYTTLGPLTRSTRWWLRGWEFPRVHIAITAAMAIILGVLLQSLWVSLASLVLIVCTIYQMARVFPYTMFAKTEIEYVDIPAADQTSLLAANVLMENKNRDKLRSLIDKDDPDVLLLMETDEHWQEALSEQLERYPTVVRYPLSNHYGMHFATRLKAHSCKTVFLSDDDTPTLLADLEGPTGRFFFVGLHPRPPVPGCDTEERDEQIKKSALIADRKQHPVIAMGDFNDVAWSDTSERFKKIGDFRDPRVGRGMLPSFDARYWFMRMPIDQLYVTSGIELMSFERLEDIGSDHFPMKAVMQVAQDA